MVDGRNSNNTCDFTVSVVSGLDTTHDGFSVTANANVTNNGICSGEISSDALNGFGSTTISEPLSEVEYYWMASNGGNIVSGMESLNPTIDQPGDYTLYVYDLLYCAIDSVSVTVPVSDASSNICLLYTSPSPRDS